LTVIGGSLILVTLLVLLLVSQVDPVARRFSERALEAVLHAPVELEAISISPWTSSIEARGITVFNPEGFKAGPAFQIERLALLFDPLTLFTEHPTIAEIRFDNPTVYLRHEAGRGTNIGALARAAAPVKAVDPLPATRRREFALKSVRADEGRLVVSTDMVPVGKVGLNVAPFSLDEFEEGPPLDGATIVSVLLRSLVHEMFTVKGLLPPVLDALRNEVQGV
jgi:uncharacterized protein involved in outer membrane biogenesis